MNDHKIITYVTHEAEDGAWQFFSDDEFENYEDVAMIVGLGEVVEKRQNYFGNLGPSIRIYCHKKR